MKRLMMAIVLALISGFGTGCFTGASHALTHGRSLAFDMVTVSLDIVTFPVQLPFWLDYCGETSLDKYYKGQCMDNQIKAAKAALAKDFNVVIRNRDYLEKYDEDGCLKPGFVALTSYLSERRNVQKLTRRQAEHLAFYALKHPDQFADWRGIWEADTIGRDLRQRARTFLVNRCSEDHELFRWVLGSHCYTDEELIEIMRTSTSRAEVYEASSVLRLRR